MNHHVISPEEYRALIDARDAAIRAVAHWSREAGRWRGIAEGLEIERDRLRADPDRRAGFGEASSRPASPPPHHARRITDMDRPDMRGKAEGQDE